MLQYYTGSQYYLTTKIPWTIFESYFKGGDTNNDKPADKLSFERANKHDLSLEQMIEEDGQDLNDDEESDETFLECNTDNNQTIDN